MNIFLDEPVIKGLFYSVIRPKEDDIIFDPKKGYNYNATLLKIYLKNFGLSDVLIKKVIFQFYKHIQFITIIFIKLKKIINSKETDLESKALSIYYYKRVFNSSALMIAKKLFENSDNKKNIKLFYAKLLVLRKFREVCLYKDLYNSIVEAIVYEFNKNVKNNKEKLTIDQDLDHKEEKIKVIDISQYIINSKI